jgi:hypothetical protein
MILPIYLMDIISMCGNTSLFEQEMFLLIVKRTKAKPIDPMTIQIVTRTLTLLATKVRSISD